MTSLHLLRMNPDPQRLAVWAHQRGLVGRGDDMGYALHVALTESFGDRAPRPFRLVEPDHRMPRPPPPVLYAYAPVDDDVLRKDAQAYADPAVYSALGLGSLESKAMPSAFETGQRLGFEVRLRPIVRSRVASDRMPASAKPPFERDAFLHACDQAGEDAVVDRDAVYIDWLADRLERNGGARLAQRPAGDGLGAEQVPRPWADVAGFRRTRVLRRPLAADGSRKDKEVEGPDALVRGVLDVTDPEAFGGLLATGIGRHRAFGYGMLLLRPPPPA